MFEPRFVQSSAACRGRFDGFGLLQPRRERSVGQQTGGKRTGIHDADALRLEIRHRLVHEPGILQRVLVVREDAVDVDLVADEPEDPLRIAAEADEPHLARLLDLAECRDRFVDDLLHGDELNIVAENDIEMVRPQPVQADIDAFGHPPVLKSKWPRS